MTAYGQIHGEPADRYHATNAVSNGRLLDFARPNVPLLYYRKYVGKLALPEESTAALDFGSFFHCLALEGEEEADRRFAVMPKFDLRTTAGKTAAEDWAVRNASREPVTEADYDLAWKMVRSIRSRPRICELLAHGKPEVVFRHKLAAFDIQCRCDWFDDRRDEWQRPLILDVKTIDHLANFDRQFQKFGYWRGAGFYQMVVHQTLALPGAFPRYLFIAVEKNEPFQCAIREPDELALDLGRQAVIADLQRLKTCYETNAWPGEPDEVIPVSLPDWMINKGAA